MGDKLKTVTLSLLIVTLLIFTTGCTAEQEQEFRDKHEDEIRSEVQDIVNQTMDETEWGSENFEEYQYEVKLYIATMGEEIPYSGIRDTISKWDERYGLLTVEVFDAYAPREESGERERNSQTYSNRLLEFSQNYGFELQGEPYFFLGDNHWFGFEEDEILREIRVCMKEGCQ